MSYIIEDEKEREALKDKVRERKLRCWVRDNYRSFQNIDPKRVPQELRMHCWEQVLLEECRKINREMGTDLSVDP